MSINNQYQEYMDIVLVSNGPCTPSFDFGFS